MFHARKLGLTGWRIALAGVDALLIAGSLLAAIWLRYDNATASWLVDSWSTLHLLCLITFAVGGSALLFMLRMYSHSWLHAGMEAAHALLLASSILTLVLALGQTAIFGRHLARSVFPIFWLTNTASIGGLRVVIRLVLRRRQKRRRMTEGIKRKGQEHKNGNGRHAVRRTRALIVGDAEQAAGIIRAMCRTTRLKNYDVVGILDPHPNRHRMLYSGVNVLGDPKLLNRVLLSEFIDEVIFTVTDVSDSAAVRQQVMICRKHKIPAKVVPNYTEALVKPNTFRLEDVRVEDLLRRPLRNMDVSAFTNYLVGKRVLVTGAGGSIGSEICRQVMSVGPSKIILLGHGENSIFRIQRELAASYPDQVNKIVPVIASITSTERIDKIFSELKPEVVFHAAAHKHLPLMEHNVCEAAYNNVVGTWSVVQSCIKNGVRRFVQISTDKAAEPSSVMGATKRLCELLIGAAAKTCPQIDFVCVRFGNVLGSRGSVVPVFASQIRSGGPVTVTHPDMTRYVMTIPEAVRLVIQAGDVGHSGELYVLDMGTPVRILDLAEDMIRLNGFEPYVDIPIVFTGMRPGEKMHEELAGHNERIECTQYDGLNCVRCAPAYSWDEVSAMVERIKIASSMMDTESILSTFRKYIPGYASTAVNNTAVAAH